MADPKICASCDVRFLMGSTFLLGQQGCELTGNTTVADTTMTPESGDAPVETSLPTYTNWGVTVKGYAHTGTGGMSSLFALLGSRTPIVAKVEMGNPTVEYYTGNCWLESCKLSATSVKDAATYDLTFKGTGVLTPEAAA